MHACLSRTKQLFLSLNCGVGSGDGQRENSKRVARISNALPAAEPVLLSDGSRKELAAACKRHPVHKSGLQRRRNNEKREKQGIKHLSTHLDEGMQRYESAVVFGGLIKADLSIARA